MVQLVNTLKGSDLKDATAAGLIKSLQSKLLQNQSYPLYLDFNSQLLDMAFD